MSIAPTFILRGLTVPVHSVSLPPATANESASSTVHHDLLSCGDASGVVHLYKLSTRREVAQFPLHLVSVTRVIQLAEGRLFSQGRDRVALLSDLKTGKELSTILTGCDSFCRADAGPLPHMSASSTFVGCASEDTAIAKVWDAHSEEVVCALDPSSLQLAHGRTGMCMEVRLFSSASASMAMGSYEDGTVRIWDLRSAKCLSSLTLMSDPLLSSALVPSETGSSSVICGGAGDTLFKVALDLPAGTMELDKSLPLPRPGISSITVRYDGLVGTAGWDRRARLFSAKSLKPLAVLAYHKDGVLDTTFAARGAGASKNLLVTSSSDCKVALWNVY